MIPLAMDQVVKRRGTGRRSVEVLREVTLAVAPGEFVLLEGPSGSGKTTLLGVAGGLLTPDAGAVTLAGRPLARETAAGSRAVRARHVGLVFQRANLLEGLTARENVLLMAFLAGMRGPDARRETGRLLERLGLASLADRRPDELSGGEEQRVAVARGLVHGPVLVLADEPTGSLDAATGHAVAQSLAELARERGTAVLVATHDASLARLATRRLRLVDGRVREA